MKGELRAPGNRGLVTARQRAHSLHTGMLTFLRVHEEERRQRHLDALAHESRDLHLGALVADRECHEGQLFPVRFGRCWRPDDDAVLEIDILLLGELAERLSALYQVLTAFQPAARGHEPLHVDKRVLLLLTEEKALQVLVLVQSADELALVPDADLNTLLHCILVLDQAGLEAVFERLREVPREGEDDLRWLPAHDAPGEGLLAFAPRDVVRVVLRLPNLSRAVLRLRPQGVRASIGMLQAPDLRIRALGQLENELLEALPGHGLHVAPEQGVSVRGTAFHMASVGAAAAAAKRGGRVTR